MTSSQDFILCICTYKRTSLLELLLEDVLQQSVQPAAVIIVDGDPCSGLVRQMLQDRKSSFGWEIIYLPSNHSNLAYQRYLGWLIVRQTSIPWLLYLDDDLRLLSRETLKTLLIPVHWSNNHIAGITAMTGGKGPYHHSVGDPWLVRLFGATRRTGQGGLTPTGARVWPVHEKKEETFKRVYWLQGRVMLIKMNALSDNSFSHDMFALTHIKCGLGEDTVLSLRILPHGQFWCVMDEMFHHPDADMPNSYPTGAYEYGYAFAYSRRLVNDNYRYPNSPRVTDRFALIVGYLGNSLLAIWRAILHPRSSLPAYAHGYLVGAIHGLTQKPVSQTLTPDVDWSQDAISALENQEILRVPMLNKI